MIKKRIWPITFAAAMVLGLIASVLLLIPRFSLEQQEKDILIVMSYSDVRRLSRYSEKSTAEVLDALADVGVGGIVLYRSELGTAIYSPEQFVRKAGLQVIPYDVPAEAIPADASLYLTGYRGVAGDPAAVIAELERRKLPLALIETSEQTGYYQSDVFSDYRGDRVKCYQLWDFRARSYGALGYEGSEEIENALFRASVERGHTLLWITTFYHNNVVISDVEEYRIMIDRFTERLTSYHYHLGSTATAYPVWDVSVPLLVLAVWGIASAGLLLLTRFGVPRRLSLIALIAVLPCLIVLAFWNVYLLQLAGALATSVIAPLWAIWWMLSALYQVQRERPCFRVLLCKTLCTLARCFAIVFLGGTTIASLLADSKFFLGLTIFRGVKISQLVPLAVTALVVFVVFYHRMGRSLWGDLVDLVRRFRRHALLKCVCLAVLMGAALTLFILRTGNVAFTVPAIELRFRSFLESVMYARPRTKELLIAYPAFLGLFWVTARNFKILILPFSLLSVIGFTSVANTFCHGHAPYFLSLIRADNALLLGTLFALVLVVIAEAVWTRWDRWMKRKTGQAVQN